MSRLLKFNLMCAAGIGLSVVLLNAQVNGLGWNVRLSKFIAIVLVSIWNFLLNLKFGWGCGVAEAPGPLGTRFLSVLKHDDSMVNLKPVRHRLEGGCSVCRSLVGWQAF